MLPFERCGIEKKSNSEFSCILDNIVATFKNKWIQKVEMNIEYFVDNHCGLLSILIFNQSYQKKREMYLPQNFNLYTNI